ncbi:MAG: hypothetical protein Sylvanvirus3_4 [Sylvanvirus sp.]|uniref:GPI inositol-deacylase PGAP1-like alpha/beta domain-containing protein n=1 Tax=Sylvanvirus sp. TaxID=2487774 RepID=A0A3G5AHB6_9VIRU|nr:MAG: hypothetical protein Sylvanvirus3_4 [Sylvanvirus sp.]
MPRCLLYKGSRMLMLLLRAALCLACAGIDICVIFIYALDRIIHTYTSINCDELYNSCIFLFEPSIHAMDISTPCDVPVRSNTLLFLIHGSGSSERQFMFVRSWLKRMARVETINLSNDNRDLSSLSDQVATRLLEIASPNNPHLSVILVGVSMGGLIATDLAVNPDWQHVRDQIEIRGVVTMGSPLIGAPLLAFGQRISQQCTQMWSTIKSKFLSEKNVTTVWLLSKRHIDMTPRSPWLTRLHLHFKQYIEACQEKDKSQIETRSPCAWLTMGSLSDIHVPDEYSTLQSIIDTIQVPISVDRFSYQHMTFQVPGHIALTVSPDIFQQLGIFYKNHKA